MTLANTAHIVFLVALAMTGRAGAEPMTGNPAHGLSYARAVCADCHIVEPSQKSVVFIHSLSFAEIAADSRMTGMGIRAFLRTPHTAMPDFILTQQQTDDLVAYILSLKVDAGE